MAAEEAEIAAKKLEEEATAAKLKAEKGRRTARGDVSFLCCHLMYVALSYARGVEAAAVKRAAEEEAARIAAEKKKKAEQGTTNLWFSCAMCVLVYLMSVCFASTELCRLLSRRS
jgi:hypothetical protein